MPVKRRRPKVKRPPLTPEAFAAYEAGDEAALCVALGLKPWMWNPMKTAGEMPRYLENNDWHARLWREARALRDELEAACARE